MNHDLHTGRPERRPVGTIAFPDGADFAPEMTPAQVGAYSQKIRRSRRNTAALSRQRIKYRYVPKFPAALWKNTYKAVRA